MASACVEIDWVVVLASLTSRVNDPSFRIVISKTGLRIAVGIIRQLTTQFTIRLINSFCGHWFDQQVGHCPDQRIQSVWGMARQADRKIAMRISGKSAHLIL